jgi:hypothetical protein
MRRGRSAASAGGSAKRGEASQAGVGRKLTDLLLGNVDPQKEKRRMLKGIAKSLRKLNPRYYNFKTERVEAGLPKTLHEFFRALNPAQKILQNAKSSKVLKAIVIESSLSKEHLALKERLSEESVRARGKTAPYAKLVEEIKQDTKAFFGCFDLNRTKEVNDTYAALSTLLNLIHFDYYTLLRKFDPGMTETHLAYEPHFEATSADYVREELKDFVAVLTDFDPSLNWDGMWEILRAYRNTEIVPRDAWRKLLHLIRRLRRTRELELLTQLACHDPFFKPRGRSDRENIVDDFLQKTRMQNDLLLQKIAKDQRTSQIQQLLQQLFGSSSHLRLMNYTEESNALFAKKALGGYSYTLPLNCLHAFLKDFIDLELRQLVDLLVVRATWTDNSPSKLLSEAFHQLHELTAQIERFDAELGEDSETGRRLHSMVTRADRFQQSQFMARKLLKKIDDSAKDMLVRASGHVISLGKVLKQVFEDLKRPSPKLILNWPGLIQRSKRDPKQMFVSTYRKLYCFVQLIKLYV